MRRVAAALLALTVLAAGWALALDPWARPGEASHGQGEGGGAPLTLELHGSLAVDTREVPCPGAGDCVEVRWRPNVQAAALAPGAYEATATVEGTAVSNACAFTAPASVACNDTAEAQVPDHHVQTVPGGGEACRTVVAVLENAGVWVAQDRHDRCVQAETTP